MLPVAAILASRSTKIDDGTVARLLTTEQLLTSEPDCLVLEVVVMHVGVSMGWDMGEAKATSKRGSFGKGVHHSCFATRRCVNGLEGGRGKVSGESLRAGWPFVWIARVEINMERALGGMVGVLGTSCDSEEKLYKSASGYTVLERW